MAESAFAGIQRRQIEITIGELWLTDDHFIRQGIIERLRHLISHADPSMDLTQLSDPCGRPGNFTRLISSPWKFYPANQID